MCLPAVRERQAFLGKAYFETAISFKAWRGQEYNMKSVGSDETDVERTVVVVSVIQVGFIVLQVVYKFC